MAGGNVRTGLVRGVVAFGTRGAEVAVAAYIRLLVGGGIAGLAFALVLGIAILARRGARTEGAGGAGVSLAVVVTSTAGAVTGVSGRAAAGGTLRSAQVVRLTYLTRGAHVVAVGVVALTRLYRAPAGDYVTFLRKRWAVSG